MRLDDVVADVPGATIEGRPALDVAGLAYDSRHAVPGSLFFCVPGYESDGHDFAPQAIERGASALVVERPLRLGVPEVQVPSVRAAMGLAAARFHGYPSRRLAVVGVTGTNGKTTTTFLVRHLLEVAGRQCGLLGTVTSVIGGVEHPVARTTPEAIDLQADLRAMVDGGDRACAMEVSSHALALDRVGSVVFAARVFTNLTQDHLDFHPSMEDYFQAKRRLFEASEGARIVNVDDPYGRRLADEHPDASTFAIERDADFRATDLVPSRAGARFRLHAPFGSHELSLPLHGRFNVSNALAALAAVHALGVASDQLLGAISEAPAVPGRFQAIDEGQEFTVLVDYAHTPDSLSGVLRAARELTGGRVLCVFGAGGDRDRGKRPLMGAIASDLADLVLVTSDNPRSEDPDAIVAEIMAGAGDGARSMVDRRAAIATAVREAARGDVLVIAGKGHEQGQELAGGRKIPFDDVTVARHSLRELLDGVPAAR